MNNASAQWVQQTSPTKNNLTDIAFFDARLGYATGTNGTVLKTLNGGRTWQTVTAPDSTDVTSVTILDSFAVMVTTAGTFGEGAVYESRNQGGKWFKVLHDSRTFYGCATPHKNLYSVSSQIYKSENFGRTWQAQQPVNSTSTYIQAAFSDEQNGIIAGNISGILTYSADFWRTTDGGTNWYRGNSFSFPNANGFSTFDAVSPDTVLMFTNFYNRFAEGDSSQLIVLTNFNLKNEFGDSIWYFTTKIINQSFPDKLSDCKFFSGGVGYTTSKTGSIYATRTFGKKWKQDYNSKTPLHALFMLSEGVGYAVGDGGLILKREPVANAEANPDLLTIKVYPNPATSVAALSFKLDKTASVSVELRNAEGNAVLIQPAKTYDAGEQKILFRVNNLQRGIYHVNLLANGKTIGKTQLMIVH
jgi:photosystem II stability/assembly factor-like uncharacterized protein